MKPLRTLILLATCSLPFTPASQAVVVTENFEFLAIGSAVPDGTGTGLVNLQNIASSIVEITDVSVSLHLSGGGLPGFTGINGDLYAYLQHDTGFSVLINRPGMNAANPFGYFDPWGIQVTFNDAGTDGDIHTYQDQGIMGDTGPVTGTFQPDGRILDGVGTAPDLKIERSLNQILLKEDYQLARLLEMIKAN